MSRYTLKSTTSWHRSIKTAKIKEELLTYSYLFRKQGEQSKLTQKQKKLADSINELIQLLKSVKLIRTSSRPPMQVVTFWDALDQNGNLGKKINFLSKYISLVTKKIVLKICNSKTGMKETLSWKSVNQWLKCLPKSPVIRKVTSGLSTIGLQIKRLALSIR